MAKFKVIIREVLEKVVEVEAENEVSASAQVQKKYCKEEIVLTADDFSYSKFEVVKENG